MEQCISIGVSCPRSIVKHLYFYFIVFAYFIGTYLTVNLFIPMFRQIGNLSIYAVCQLQIDLIDGTFLIFQYLEQRFSLTVRIVITLSYILVTVSSRETKSQSMFRTSIFVQIFYIAVILYGPSLALSQVTGLHIWLAVGSCGIICTLYTSIVCILLLKYVNMKSIE